MSLAVLPVNNPRFLIHTDTVNLLASGEGNLISLALNFAFFHE